MTQGHAFGMFRCKQQCINALETYRRHVPTLWCGFVWGQWKITGGNDYALLPNREWDQKQNT